MVLKLGVIGLTRGTDMQAVIDAIAQGGLPGVEIAMMLSNRYKAGILERASNHCISHKFVSAMKEGAAMSREEYD
jgi:phosphoribosylglycinamide formyltransferase-1